MERGTLLWIHPQRKFGFISREGHERDLFTHVALFYDGEDRPEAGDLVEFDVNTSSPKGPMAVGVRKVRAEPPAKAPDDEDPSTLWEREADRRAPTREP
jgi:cold shock CspA family protein